MDETDIQKRAEMRRQRMTITRCSLEDSHIDPDPVYGAEAISLAAVLTRQAWTFSRRPFPKYARYDIPVHFTVATE